ncbi:MAG: phenylacetic acid degradation b [Cyclobacteriaceae bacterium]|nr:phenylacetic acid degradation b [Cyclobacteriaceae bacterium]MCB0498548.1 phenylacetic acid degradation b [Cyclobacteriaceae bacterium]MCB9236885.1 phenylacetic acid degradation b [Flammeovirgaceae bacterium]MCW5901408.1 phenylacetic acid degradation b [Cyclobacteriaceae bacterium]
MPLKSLDPRVNRLPAATNSLPKAPLDQFGTFEVFVQAREGKPFQHEGAVHAPNVEMAYVLAKETFTRRFTCVSIYVADTRNVHVSPLTEGMTNAYDNIKEVPSDGNSVSYEIYHLFKRGKQHQHAGTVKASNANEALWLAKGQLKPEKQVFNIWAIRTNDIRFTQPEDLDLWQTLPEKKFRDAAAYKGGDKLKSFLEKQKNNNP